MEGLWQFTREVKPLFDLLLCCSIVGAVSGRLSDDSRYLGRRGEVLRRYQYSSSLCSGGRGDHPFFLPGMSSMVEVDMMK